MSHLDDRYMSFTTSPFCQENRLMSRLDDRYMTLTLSATSPLCQNIVWWAAIKQWNPLCSRSKGSPNGSHFSPVRNQPLGDSLVCKVNPGSLPFGTHLTSREDFAIKGACRRNQHAQTTSNLWPRDIDSRKVIFNYKFTTDFRLLRIK